MMNAIPIAGEHILASFARPELSRSYAPWRETRRQLKAAWRRHLADHPEKLSSLMDRLGFRNKNKFLRRTRWDWLTLRKPIPLPFLHAVGLDLETLRLSLARDRAAFEAALRDYPFPEYLSCRVIPGFSLRIPLPRRIPEAEAVTRARQILVRYRRTGPRDYALVIYPGLKEIRVTRKDSVLLIHTPRIIHSGDRLCFLTGGLG